MNSHEIIPFLIDSMSAPISKAIAAAKIIFSRLYLPTSFEEIFIDVPLKLKLAEVLSCSK